MHAQCFYRIVLHGDDDTTIYRLPFIDYRATLITLALVNDYSKLSAVVHARLEGPKTDWK
jgi:hypothetical protein